MTLVFWGSVALMLYAYFGYYLLLSVLSWIRPRPVRAAHFTPTVSILVPVHNNAVALRAKLANLAALDYPRELLQIIVISDGSTDDTLAVAQQWQDPPVVAAALAVNSGKEEAQREGLRHATGEICVLTDVATQLEPAGLRRILEPFADPTVGAVTSRNVAPPGTGEGAFIRYDMTLRELESTIGSVVGLSGAFSAVRRHLCDQWPKDVPSDFYVLLTVVLRGFRGVYARDAVAIYGTTDSVPGEFRRKVRTVQRGIAALMRARRVLLPWRTGFFAVQMLSHKLLRWCVPFLLVAALVSNAALVVQPLYHVIFVLQVVFYCIALLAISSPRLRSVRVARLIGFMVLTNFSILVAWWRYARHGTMQVWQPTAR